MHAWSRHIDFVEDELDKFVKKYRQDSFHNHIMLDINFIAAHDARCVTYASTRFVCHTQYDISAGWGDSEPGSVDIIAPQSPSYELDEDIKKLLRNSLDAKPRTQLTIGDAGKMDSAVATKCQAEWWATNGRTFSFASLPQELRFMVLEQVILDTDDIPRSRIAMANNPYCAKQSLLYCNRQMHEDMKSSIKILKKAGVQMPHLGDKKVKARSRKGEVWF